MLGLASVCCKPVLRTGPRAAYSLRPSPRCAGLLCKAGFSSCARTRQNVVQTSKRGNAEALNQHFIDAAAAADAESKVHGASQSPGKPSKRRLGTEDRSVQKWRAKDHIRRTTSTLGTQLDAGFSSRNILDDPPNANEVTLELLLAAQTHLGHARAVWNPANARYIFGERDGIHIISLDSTLQYLRRAASVVAAVAESGGMILFIGTRPGMERSVIRAAELADPAYYIFDHWIPGTISNSELILPSNSIHVVDQFDRPQEGFQAQLANFDNPKPDLVVCLNPDENMTLLRECARATIPTIGIIDTNADPASVTYPIPANDDSPRSIQLIAGVLGRAGQDGQIRRLELAVKDDVQAVRPNSLNVEASSFNHGAYKKGFKAAQRQAAVNLAAKTKGVVNVGNVLRYGKDVVVERSPTAAVVKPQPTEAEKYSFDEDEQDSYFEGEDGKLYTFEGETRDDEGTVTGRVYKSEDGELHAYDKESGDYKGTVDESEVHRLSDGGPDDPETIEIAGKVYTLDSHYRPGTDGPDVPLYRSEDGLFIYDRDTGNLQGPIDQDDTQAEGQGDQSEYETLEELLDPQTAQLWSKLSAAVGGEEQVVKLIDNDEATLAAAREGLTEGEFQRVMALLERVRQQAEAAVEQQLNTDGSASGGDEAGPSGNIEDPAQKELYKRRDALQDRLSQTLGLGPAQLLDAASLVEAGDEQSIQRVRAGKSAADADDTLAALAEYSRLWDELSPEGPAGRAVDFASAQLSPEFLAMCERHGVSREDLARVWDEDMTGEQLSKFIADKFKG